MCAPPRHRSLSEGIIEWRQRLSFEGKRLDDDVALADIGVERGSVLRLDVSMRIAIADDVGDAEMDEQGRARKKEIVVSAHLADAVDDVKRMIQDELSDTSSDTVFVDVDRRGGDAGPMVKGVVGAGWGYYKRGGSSLWYPATDFNRQ